MGLFSRKKEDKKKEKAEDKTVEVNDDKKFAGSKSMKELYSENNKKPKIITEDKKSGAAKSLAPDKKEKSYGYAYRILVKPLMTEKASSLNAENKYVFAVARDANKIEVSRAIKEVYGIKPVSVNIINVIGKRVRSGKISGQRKNWKKAIITLPQGESIKVYEGV